MVDHSRREACETAAIADFYDAAPAELAERAGISRGLLQRIEKGDLGCRIGAVFEAAVLVGIKLFDADEVSLATRIRQADDKIALLPKHIHPGKKVVDDDF